jgi:SAM-dependent methyltransferase
VCGKFFGGAKLPKGSDEEYLRTQQYKTADNLNARIRLHALYSTNKLGWQRWLFEQLHLANDGRFLEVGCGPGNLWAENAARVPGGWRLLLTDFSPGMIGQARQKLGGDNRFAFAVAAAQALPCADGQFDAVLASHMLYHVPDRERALADIRRALAAGGRLYATTVGAAHMRDLDDLVSRFDPAIAETGIGLGKPYAPFSLENGCRQLESVFTNVRLTRYEDSLVVTDVAPLVDYILSGTDALPPERVEDLSCFVQHELGSRGVMHITKDSGLFEAWR